MVGWIGLTEYVQRSNWPQDGLPWRRKTEIPKRFISWQPTTALIVLQRRVDFNGVWLRGHKWVKGEGRWVWWKTIDESLISGGCALGFVFVWFLLVFRLRCHLPRVDLVRNFTATAWAFQSLQNWYTKQWELKWGSVLYTQKNHYPFQGKIDAVLLFFSREQAMFFVRLKIQRRSEASYSLRVSTPKYEW